jgi:hypothetical protein
MSLTLGQEFARALKDKQRHLADQGQRRPEDSLSHLELKKKKKKNLKICQFRI